jgi:hypothetical protein
MTSVNRLHTLLWEQMKKLPDGHRIFQAPSQVYIGSLPAELVNDPRDLWALADNSGTYPHDTEDGVMWLDYRRPLTAGLSATEQNEGLFPSIPLVTKDGKPVGTVTDPSTLLWLSEMFRWDIRANGVVYRAIRL